MLPPWLRTWFGVAFAVVGAAALVAGHRDTGLLLLAASIAAFALAVLSLRARPGEAEEEGEDPEWESFERQFRSYADDRHAGTQR
jgi:hypothetical protein